MATPPHNGATAVVGGSAAAGLPPAVAPPVDSDEDLQALYNWIDEVPLSRPKRNISRDFADGVLFAEMMSQFFPKLVEMHNYSAANSNQQKLANWNTLNMRVLRKLGYQLHASDIDDVIKASPGAIERVLWVTKELIEGIQSGRFKAPVAGGRPSRASLSGPAAESVALAGLHRAVVPAQSGRGGPLAQSSPQSAQASVVQLRMDAAADTEILLEKERTIVELREMVGIMAEKIKKLEQLVHIKDSKIEALSGKLNRAGLS